MYKGQGKTPAPYIILHAGPEPDSLCVGSALAEPGTPTTREPVTEREGYVARRISESKSLLLSRRRSLRNKKGAP
jgi:hypothetical protein